VTVLYLRVSLDNTPTEVADQLDVQTRPSIMASFLFANAMSTMWKSISLAASSCPISNSGKHKFHGYPRRKAKCRSCSTPLFKE